MKTLEQQLEDLKNCSEGASTRGRFSTGDGVPNPHAHCHHFEDARDYYGPLHGGITWMKIKEERDALGFTVDAYVRACADRGIGTAQEHEEFRDNLYGIQ